MEMPIKVKVIEGNGESYQIRFPKIVIPVTVDRTIYDRMVESPLYEFEWH